MLFFFFICFVYSNTTAVVHHQWASNTLLQITILNDLLFCFFFHYLFFFSFAFIFFSLPFFFSFFVSYWLCFLCFFLVVFFSLFLFIYFLGEGTAGAGPPEGQGPLKSFKPIGWSVSEVGLVNPHWLFSTKTVFSITTVFPPQHHFAVIFFKHSCY